MTPATPPAEALSRWGGGEMLRPLPGGHRNAAYLVRVAGLPMVLKSTRQSEPSLRWQAAVQRLAARAGFRVPMLRPSLSGCLSARGWTLEPFLDGAHPGPAALRTLSPAIRRFHALSACLPDRPRCSSLDGAARGPRLPRVTPGRRTIIHGDLNPGNVLWADGQPPGLIDWDEARRDDPCLDLLAIGAPLPARAATAAARQALIGEIAGAWRQEPGYARAMLRRYRARAVRPGACGCS